MAVAMRVAVAAVFGMLLALFATPSLAQDESPSRGSAAGPSERRPKSRRRRGTRSSSSRAVHCT